MILIKPEQVLDLSKLPPLPSQAKAAAVAAKVVSPKANAPEQKASIQDLQKMERTIDYRKKDYLERVRKEDPDQYAQIIEEGAVGFMVLQELGLPTDGDARIARIEYSNEWVVQEQGSWSDGKGRSYLTWNDRPAPQGVDVTKMRNEARAKYRANVNNHEFRAKLAEDMDKASYYPGYEGFLDLQLPKAELPRAES